VPQRSNKRPPPRHETNDDPGKDTRRWNRSHKSRPFVHCSSPASRPTARFFSLDEEQPAFQRRADVVGWNVLISLDLLDRNDGGIGAAGYHLKARFHLEMRH
jgi:hypothetical protein